MSEIKLKKRATIFWVKFCLFLVKLSGKRLYLKSHNGCNIFDYPEINWNIAPFPIQKGDLFNSDNLATVNRHNYLQNNRFIKAKKAAEARWDVTGNVRDISWRLHIVLWAFGLAIKNSRKEKSIAIECGTGRGYMAAGILEYWQEGIENFPLYLIDTFASQLVLQDGEMILSPADFAYADGDDEVKNYFSRFENVKIIKGFIPDVLEELPNKKISFLHLDLNNSEAEESALKALIGQFIDGAVILFDDYGGPGGEEQALVHEKFAKENCRELLVLPTGQALIIW